MRLEAKDLCPLPVIPEAVPPTVGKLEQLLDKTTEGHSLLLYVLGTLHLRNGQWDKALHALKESSGESPEHGGVLCHLALAYIGQSRHEEALSLLKQANLLSPELPVIYLHLARTQHALGDRRAAIATLERAKNLGKVLSDGLLLLGEYYEEENSDAAALEVYQEVLASDESNTSAAKYLAYAAFKQGAELLKKDEFEPALLAWKEAYERFPQTFSSASAVVQQLQELIKSPEAVARLKAAEEAYQADKTPENAYLLILHFLFSLGALPELYTSRESLAEELEHWQSQARSEEGVLPFPHFRIGVLKCLQGDFDAGYESLSFARDHLPPSKHRPLRIEALLGFLREWVERPEEDTSLPVEELPDAHWERAGFTDLFQRSAWKKSGLQPGEAAHWRRVGFSPVAAGDWARAGFKAVEAQSWTDAGFLQAKEAKRWHKGGLDIEEAGRWRLVFKEDIGAALQCKQVGIEDPSEAGEWLKHFTFPSEAELWKRQGFSPEQAAQHLAQGAKDPFLVRQSEALSSVSNGIGSNEAEETTFEQPERSNDGEAD